jgi:hypothetical protein
VATNDNRQVPPNRKLNNFQLARTSRKPYNCQELGLGRGSILWHQFLVNLTFVDYVPLLTIFRDSHAWKTERRWFGPPEGGEDQNLTYSYEDEFYFPASSYFVAPVFIYIER